MAKRKLNSLLNKMPKGAPSTPKELSVLADFRKTGETFAIFFDLGTRAARVGVKPVEVFNCKPWEVPTVGDVTPEQIQLFRSAVEKAESKQGVK